MVPRPRMRRMWSKLPSRCSHQMWTLISSWIRAISGSWWQSTTRTCLDMLAHSSPTRSGLLRRSMTMGPLKRSSARVRTQRRWLLKHVKAGNLPAHYEQGVYFALTTAARIYSRLGYMMRYTTTRAYLILTLACESPDRLYTHYTLVEVAQTITMKYCLIQWHGIEWFLCFLWPACALKC